VFIYHFHRIIRHRLVWGVFAIGIAFLFLFNIDSCFRNPGSSVATIGGKSVTSEMYNAVEHHIRGVGRGRDNSLPAAEVATQVWQRIAAMQVADELNLQTTPREIKEGIMEDPSFQSQGAFDKLRYAAILRENGMTPSVYEDYRANQMALRKMYAIIDGATWISPIEENDELAGWTDQITIQYATISNHFASSHMDVSAEKMRAFYEEHTNFFRLPDRRAVDYVALPVSNFLARVTVSEEDVHAYYEDHSEKFVHVTESNTTETIKESEARPKIVAALRLENARHAAATNLANSFLELAIKGGFSVAARDFSLEIQHSPFFAADEELPEVADAGKAFTEGAFELDFAQPESRYNVIRGSNYVYAIAYRTNSPAHLPTFEEAASRVKPQAVAKERHEAFREKTEKLHSDLVLALKEGKTFDKVTREKAMNVSTSITITAHTVSRDSFDNAFLIVQGALHLRPGEISEAGLLPGQTGAVFVYMMARQPGDPLAAKMLREQVRNGLERSRGSALFESWLEWNLAQRKLVVSEKMAASLAASASKGEE
jgi:parvulin-like peptidyl-prolyl isomerase